MANDSNFDNVVHDILENKKFNKLNKELHHGITRYEHSMRVASWTYKICEFFHMKDTSEVTRASLLHDFFVNEDLVSTTGPGKLKEHPEVALENSMKYFDLNPMQQDIIKNHMFPCTFTIPKYKESWLVSLVDKAVSTYEQLRYKSALYAGVYMIFIFELIRVQK